MREEWVVGTEGKSLRSGKNSKEADLGFSQRRMSSLQDFSSHFGYKIEFPQRCEWLVYSIHEIRCYHLRKKIRDELDSNGECRQTKWDSTHL